MPTGTNRGNSSGGKEGSDMGRIGFSSLVRSAHARSGVNRAPESCRYGARAGIAAVAIPFLQFAVAAAPSPAFAHDVFHIFTPRIEAGHWGFEAISGFAFGMPREEAHHEGEEDEEEEGQEHPHGAVRAAHELAIHGGVTQFWTTKLTLGLEREDGGSYRATSIASENVLRLWPEREGSLDVAWFTAVSLGLDSGEPHDVEFGPIVSLAAGPLALVLNPFLEKTFGRNREEGIGFTYGWRATYSLSEQLAVGIEGYGVIENLGNAPDADDQIHRIGPVIYLGHLHGGPRHDHDTDAGGHGAHGAGHDHANGQGGHEHGHGSRQTTKVHTGLAQGPEWHAEIGVLFGLTEATPDAALKLNLGLDF